MLRKGEFFYAFDVRGRRRLELLLILKQKSDLGREKLEKVSFDVGSR